MADKRIYNTDLSIVEGILADDDRALVFLLHKYNAQIIEILQQSVGRGYPKSERLQLLDDALLVFLKKTVQGKFFPDKEGSIVAFLSRICRFKLRQRWDELGKENYSDLEEAPAPYELPAWLDEETPAAQSHRENLAAYCLDQLNEKQRALVLGYYQLKGEKDKRAFETLATRLGYANATVAKVMKHKVMNQLRDCVQDKK